MDRLRRCLYKILPTGWWKRIDLENASIEAHVTDFAQSIEPGQRVLDAGAGQCRYRLHFAHTDYYGVDFGGGEGQWDYSRLDALARLEQLPFPDATFDYVVFTQVLEHVAEPLEILKELFRVLKPGGTMLMTAPLGFGEHQIPYDFFRYTRYGLRHLLDKVGFKTIDLQPRGGYFRYMAVMSMWFYIYFFPETRPLWLKLLLSPLQLISAVMMIAVIPPVLQSLDFLDTEKRITLGFAVRCQREKLS